MEEDFDLRILDFDKTAAICAATLAAARQRKGLTVDMRDTQIAGIVLARRVSLATHNVRHFDDIDATVIDPWRSSCGRNILREDVGPSGTY